MLDNLPAEITELILTRLTYKNLNSVLRASKSLNEAASSPRLWKTLMLKDFNYKDANASKESYKAILEGLAKERDNFIAYRKAYLRIKENITVHSHHDYVFYDDYRNPYHYQPLSSSEYIMAGQLNHLDIAFRQSPAAFKDRCNIIDKYQMRDIIQKNLDYCGDLFSYIISDQFSLAPADLDLTDIMDIDDADVLHDKENLPKALTESIKILMRIDAGIALNILMHCLDLNDKHINSFLWDAIQYPSINVIKTYLQHNLPINKPYNKIVNDYMKILTPLAGAVLYMLTKHRDVNAAKEIVTELLAHGADPDVLIAVKDTDVENADEIDETNYQKYLQTTRSYCQKLKGNKTYMQNFSKEDQKKINEILDMVISHNIVNDNNNDNRPRL